MQSAKIVDVSQVMDARPKLPFTDYVPSVLTLGLRVTFVNKSVGNDKARICKYSL